jgi:Zn-finger nucleic acid-binding protein
MKRVDDSERQEILLELKYCERCGGLWLRPQGTDGLFCELSRPPRGQTRTTASYTTQSAAPQTTRATQRYSPGKWPRNDTS